MRDLQMGLIFGVILGAVAVYVLTQSGIIPSTLSLKPITQIADNKPIGAFKADNELPYPLNLPAVTRSNVTYSIDGTIIEAKINGANTDIRVQAIIGPKFPDPISVPNSLTVTPAATSSATPKGPNKTGKDIQVSDRVLIDLSYDSQTKKTYVSSLRYVPK